MKTTLIPLFVLASYVSAETTCPALSILDACLDTTQGYISLCGLQDFSCLCDKYTAIMTCFGNCPNDERQYSLDSTRQLYCANAIAFASKTTTASTPTKTSETQPSQTSDVTPADSSSSATTTYGAGGSGNTPSPTPNAGAVDGQRGAGLLAAIAGVVAAALL
ncbi:hypothetical protein F5X97DRAFT_128185 [Nemania serpens]|nr:hypothetical protein F5X97DRAFT_128185 [Nemania serpens]